MTDIDEQAEPYAEIAAQLIANVRDEHPSAVHRWLHLAMTDIARRAGRPAPTVTDWMSLAICLAAAGRDDVTFIEATAWRWRAVEDRRREVVEALRGELGANQYGRRAA